MPGPEATCCTLKWIRVEARAVNIKTIFDEIKIRFENCEAVDGIQIYFSVYKCPANSTTENFIRHPSPVLFQLKHFETVPIL